MMLRSLAAFCGVSILTATACVQIIATGGFLQPTSALVATLAAGVALGAVVIGHVVSQGRTMLAVWLALAMLSGEAFGFLSTAERYVVAREAQQAPFKKAAEAHAAAVARLAAAERAIPNSPKTSARLQAAEAALNDADTKVRASAADRGCRENCRALLQAQVDAARKEVDEARAELVQAARSRSDELTAARSDLQAHPLPSSATPFADRLGIAPWALDLIMAALGAFGANGLAAGLLAYSAHFKRPEEARVAAPVDVSVPATVALLKPAQIRSAQIEDARPIARIDYFASQNTEPVDDARLDFAAAHAAYCKWAESNNERAVTRKDFETIFSHLCAAIGCDVEKKGRRLYAVDLRLVA